jgi:MSHA pilin protein MshA
VFKFNSNIHFEGTIMKNQMNKQKGFTLIELIIVIVILGILAVTAAPRFIDLQSDASASALEGIKASLQGGSQLVYAKAAIAGQQTGSNQSTTVSPGVNLETTFGYPDAGAVVAIAGTAAESEVAKFVDLSTDDFDVSAATTADSFIISFAGKTETDGCYVIYTTSTSVSSAPLIDTVSDGC